MGGVMVGTIGAAGDDHADRRFLGEHGADLAGRGVGAQDQWRIAAAGRRQIEGVVIGAGRVVYLALGHDMRAWDDPLVRTLVTRAALWAVGEKEAVAV